MFYYIILKIKYLLRIIDFIVVSLVALLLSFLPKFIIDPFYHSLYRYWSRTFVRMFGIEEHFHEHLKGPLPEQYVLICNHPTGIDVIWLPASFNVVPLSKNEIGQWPFIGRITRTAGVIFVKREDAESRRASLVACLQAVKAGKNLLIFPEGGCYGKELQPFKDGAFDIASRKKIPILPVYVYYEEENTYEWGDIGPFDYIIRLLVKAKNRHAHLHIFDPIDPTQFTDGEALKNYMHTYYTQLQEKYRV